MIKYKVMITRGTDYSQFYPAITTANSICVATFTTREAANDFILNATKYDSTLRNRMYITFDIIDWTREISWTH